MLPTKDTQHVAESLALLIDQFKNKTVIKGYLSTLARRVQDVENVLWDIIELRRLDVATGIQLDKLGVLVGEKRIGRNDTDYRNGIRLRIRVNRSKGRVVDIIDVATLAGQGVNIPKVIEYQFLSFEVDLFGQTGERYIADLLSHTRAATSYGILVASDLAASSLLIWDDAVSPGGVVTFSDAISGGLVCASAYGLPSDFTGIVLASAISLTSLAPTSGSTGGATSVTLTGVNLTGTTGVTFDGVPATSVVVVNSTTVTCVTPAHAGAGAVNVTVTTPSGSSTLIGGYTYSAAGVVPVVTAVAPNVGDTLGGGVAPIVITVSSSAGCTGATVGGVALGSFTILDGMHVQGTLGAHAAGVVDVVVTNATGPSTTGTGLFEYWTPSQITGSPLWFDAERGVTQVANAVSAWAEQRAGTVNAAQATAGNKPTWTANVFGTLHSLRFARASTSYMQVTPQTVASTGTVSWRAVVKTTDATATATGTPGVDPANTIIGCSAGGGAVNGGVGGDGTAGTVNMRAYDGATWQPASGSTGVNDGNPHIIGGNVNGTSKVIQCVKDGASVGSAGTLGAGGFVTAGWDTIGAGFSLTDPLGGDLGFFLYMPSAISSGDETKLTTWSRQRWGTP